MKDLKINYNEILVTYKNFQNLIQKHQIAENFFSKDMLSCHVDLECWLHKKGLNDLIIEFRESYNFDPIDGLDFPNALDN